VNRPEPGAMSRGHVLIHCLHGGASGHLAVLFIHVVRAGARVVADPDTEVLDFLRLLLRNLERMYQYAAALLEDLVTQTRAQRARLLPQMLRL